MTWGTMGSFEGPGAPPAIVEIGFGARAEGAGGRQVPRSGCQEAADPTAEGLR